MTNKDGANAKEHIISRKIQRKGKVMEEQKTSKKEGKKEREKKKE